MPQESFVTARKPTFLSRVSKLLGSQGRTRLVRMSTKCLRNPPTIELPADLNSARNIIILLPETQLAALHQVGTVLALISRFQQAEIILLCELSVANIFEHIAGIAEIVTYDSEERYLFSQQFNEIAGMLADKEFDIGIVLEREPDISLVQLMARLCPKVRIGYDGEWDYPFLNVRIRQEASDMHITDQNVKIATALGAQPVKKSTWAVSKAVLEEIGHALNEYRLPKDCVLGGIDAGLFYKAHGREWTDALVNRLMALGKSVSWYLYCDSAGGGDLVEWLEMRGMPVFTALSPSRAAALVQRSTVIISGRAVFFELANLLSKPVIGIFEEREAVRFCKITATCRPVTYAQAANEKTVDSVGRLVLSLGLHAQVNN